MSTHITESDKIAMCKICTLAECMKQCKICPFNIGLVAQVKPVDPFLKFAERYLKNIPTGAK